MIFLMRIGIWHERKGKPSISIEPWDAGRFGSKKWDSNKYLERVEELSENSWFTVIKMQTY